MRSFATSRAIRSLPDVVTGEGIDAYSELDLRFGWRVTENWSVSLLRPEPAA